MTCDCCGAKKKLFEMFYSVGEGAEKIQLCSDCREILEHLRSDRKWSCTEFISFSSGSGRNAPARRSLPGKRPITRTEPKSKEIG